MLQTGAQPGQRAVPRPPSVQPSPRGLVWDPSGEPPALAFLQRPRSAGRLCLLRTDFGESLLVSQLTRTFNAASQPSRELCLNGGRFWKKVI